MKESKPNWSQNNKYSSVSEEVYIYVEHAVEEIYTKSVTLTSKFSGSSTPKNEYWRTNIYRLLVKVSHLDKRLDRSRVALFNSIQSEPDMTPICSIRSYYLHSDSVRVLDNRFRTPVCNFNKTTKKTTSATRRLLLLAVPRGKVGTRIVRIQS